MFGGNSKPSSIFVASCNLVANVFANALPSLQGFLLDIECRSYKQGHKVLFRLFDQKSKADKAVAAGEALGMGAVHRVVMDAPSLKALAKLRRNRVIDRREDTTAFLTLLKTPR